MTIAKASTTLSDLIALQTPFADNFKISKSANAVMMSHMFFPVAEGELRNNNTQFNVDINSSWATSRCKECPCTLSPYFCARIVAELFQIWWNRD